MSTEDYTFESTDAGASDTYPSEAGQIRKGGFIMIKGHPCKVCDCEPAYVRRDSPILPRRSHHMNE